MNITIITPTAGKRPLQLKMLVLATEYLLRDGDQHLVIWDMEAVPPDAPQGRYTTHLAYQEAGSVWGNAQRDYGVLHATGDCIVWCDDDDLPAAPGINRLHSFRPARDTFHVFDMVFPVDAYAAFAKPENMKCGHVGGPQAVAPNVPGIPKWMAHNLYTADWHWIEACMQRFKVVYHEHTTLILVRPLEKRLVT